ncbi:hypothetical protein [Defluviicoccus vanus]|nr:hypothetical protein [Defluviicoccus vanus]
MDATSFSPISPLGRWITAGVAGAVLMALLSVQPAPAATTELPKASAWNGKYPFDQKPGFYANAALKQATTALIGATRYKEVMLGWSVAAPIVTDGDALLAWGCKPHDCGDNHQSTLIDAGKVAICILQGGTATWYAEGLAKPVSSRITGDGSTACQFETVSQARQSLAAARR